MKDYYSYNKNTLMTLGAVLVPECPEHYQIIFADMLKSYIIPWARKEDLIEKTEIIQLIRDAVQKSFLPYQGSHTGAYKTEQTRELLYSVLWGHETALSLMNDDFTDTPVTCGYDEEKRNFTISLLPDGRKTAYSERQLKWCRENIPEQMKNASDSETAEYMFPAWIALGDFCTSLPKELPASKQQIEKIILHAAAIHPKCRK